MPRNISTAMQAYLNQSTVVLATLVLITRKDGVILGFTNWDIPIVYNGNTYIPAISMDPSAVKTNNDLTTDQMDIIGAIDSVYITEADIDGGRYDLAQVQVIRVCPNDFSLGQITMLTGTIGQIQYGDGNFRADINSLGEIFTQQIGDVVTPVCRVNQLGDSQCKVNISSYQTSTTVATVGADNKTLTFSNTQATGYYNYGMVRFKSTANGGGLNFNLNMEVKTSVSTGAIMTIVLVEPMPFAIHPGDAVILEAGCDRRSVTCRNKFNNLINFHGEPYVPGNNYLISTGRPPS